MFTKGNTQLLEERFDPPTSDAHAGAVNESQFDLTLVMTVNGLYLGRVKQEALLYPYKVGQLLVAPFQGLTNEQGRFCALP